MILFWPSCDTWLFTCTPLTKAESLAVAVSTLWSWNRFWLAVIDESVVGA